MAWSRPFARCLVDKRAPEKVRHTLEDLVGQRVFGIACGHPDGNDADHLADDPIHKLLLGRDPVAGGRLASQPTISRFENDAGRSALYRMGRELAASVIERHRRRLGGRARRITIDLDPTAYFGGSGSPVSAEVDHLFRSKWITDFGGSGSLSAEVDHPVSGVVSAHR